ncbi:MAG: hypothetical protein M1814_006264 [Vezdaea aestivalis]|nr:MAG: hypothetical protein M1814_006264 [Vezdaea aestivalis]
MSYDRLPSLESQPTTARQSDYTDDPAFRTLSTSLSSQIFNINSSTSRLSSQLSLLNTRRDTPRVRERVHTLLEETAASFKEVGEGVKKIQAWEDVSPSQRYTQQKLGREFQASLQEFQTVQRIAIEKTRKSVGEAREGGEDDEGRAQGENQERQGQEQLLEQEQVQLASQDEVDFQESLIVERESEIRNIEQSVGELNELFRDVAHIVSEQGGQLDIISENVEQVRGDTMGADRELRSASRYQRNARNKACCLLIVLAVVLLIIVLAVVFG